MYNFAATRVQPNYTFAIQVEHITLCVNSISSCHCYAFCLSPAPRIVIHTVKAYDEWGRGRQVGRLYAQTQIGLAVTADGSQVALLFGSRESDPAEDKLHLLVVAEDGNVSFDGELEIEIGEPRSMQVLAEPDGELNLFWFEGFREERIVRHARVSSAGAVLASSLSVISESGIYWYKASWTTAQQLQLVWISNTGQMMAANNRR